MRKNPKHGLPYQFGARPAATPAPTNTANANDALSNALLVDCLDAARLLSVSRRTLFSLTRDGVIPKVQLPGRLVRYYVPDLMKTLERLSTSTANDGGTSS